MRKDDLIDELVEKLSQYKDIEKLEKYLDETEEFFTTENKKFSIEAFPMNYITAQKENFQNLKATQTGRECDYCSKALAERKKLLKNEESVQEVVKDLNDFFKHCKKTCPNFTEEPFAYYLNDEGLECIDSMIEVFGVEKVKDFCLLNAYKFFWRCDKKDKLWDVDKGISYLSLYRKLDREYTSEREMER